MIWNIFCEKKNEIYRSFIAMLIYGTVICLGASSFGIVTVSPLFVAFIAFTFIYVICLFELTIVGKAILWSITVSAVIVKIISLGKEELTELAKDFADWFFNPLLETEHLKLYIGIVAFGVAIICYIIGCLCQKYKAIKYFVFFSGIAIAIYLMIKQEEVSKPGIAFMFVFFMFIIVEWLEGRWNKNKDDSKRTLYMVCLWPVWIISIIVMCFAPVSNEPYDWKFVKVIIENVEDAASAIADLLGIGGGDDFQVGMNGFAEDSNVGGDVEDSNKTLLQVDTMSDMLTNVYLTGFISDTFDGREWTRQYEEVSSDKKLDTLETLYAIWKYDGEGEARYVKKSSLKIEYRDFDSYYYFTPGKCYSLVVNGKNINSSDEKMTDLWNQKKREGDAYSVSYYQLNLDHEIFNEMLEAAHYDNEESWREVCKKDLNEMVDFSVLEKYRERQNTQYSGQIILSKRMQQWVEDVTWDCKGNFEKLKAIEKALSRLSYTTHPGSIPSEVDTPEEFLDYVVFEKKGGYCTYFATAFTLLARAEGLPARYVQGLSIPINGLKTISVTADMAHAWPEVYLEGVGWIPFEPTPGFYSIRYTPWKLVDEGEEIIEAPMQGLPSTPAPTPTIQDIEEEVIEEEEPKESIDMEAIMLGFIIALLLSVVILTVDIMICRLLYKKKALENRYKWEIERCIAVLARLGIKKKDDETLDDLQRIMEETYKMWDVAAPEFIAEYESALYGTKATTQKMIDNVIAERKKMKKRLKLHMRVVEEFRDYRKK